MRQIENKDLVNKTIKSIDNRCINSLILHFTDGTFIELIAEESVALSCGSIPGIFIEDKYDEVIND